MDTSIDFKWQRDPKGYTLMPEQPPNHDPNLNFLEAAGTPERVAPNSGRQEDFQPPINAVNAIYRLFGNLKTGADVLGFVQKFGPITASSAWDDVPLVLEHAAAVRSWISASNKRSRKHVLDLLSRQKDAFTILEASIETDDRGTMRIRLRPRSLLSVVWMKLVEELSNTTLRCCSHCGVIFSVGPGTDRRLDSKFCSKDHQKLHNSLKRSEAQSSAERKQRGRDLPGYRVRRPAPVA